MPLRIYYGTRDRRVDVTDVCRNKSINAMCTIPRSGGHELDKLFGDPAFGCNKSVFIRTSDEEDEEQEYNGSFEIFVNLDTEQVYARPTKVVDCFVFYNEIDMLTYRLNALNTNVDFFVIVESPYTFSGLQKPLFFAENRSLFSQFEDKIIHVVVDDMPYQSTVNCNSWTNEAFQRNAISRGIDKLKGVLNDNDLIIISDVDEIPNPEILWQLKENTISSDNNNIVFALEMDFYYYNLCTKHTSKWYFAKVLTYKSLNKCYSDGNQCNDFRHFGGCKTLHKGGWHLSYFGNCEHIKNKIKAFSHQEYNNDYFTNTANIQKKVDSCSDLFGRGDIELQNIPIADNPFLPPFHAAHHFMTSTRQW